MSILGAVLAGGRSSRFGTDKAAALWSGRTLADHADDVLRPYSDAVVRVGPGGLADLPMPGLGPLGGIAAALVHARDTGHNSVLTIGCDMPRLPDGLIAAIVRRAPAFCADAPVLGHWPVALADDLLAWLRDSAPRGPSVRGWAERIGALPIAAPAPIANVNTPADLAEL